jgi:hypothetical protein
MDRLRRRHLADGVDDAAGAAAAIQHRGGSAQDFDPLQIERLQLPARIGGIEQLQAVEKRAVVVGLEATDQEPVVARIGAERSGHNACRITQDLVELCRLLIADLFAPHDRDGLRRFVDRRVGFGADHAAAGNIAPNGPARIFLSDGGDTRRRRSWLRGTSRNAPGAALCRTRYGMARPECIDGHGWKRAARAGVGTGLLRHQWRAAKQAQSHSAERGRAQPTITIIHRIPRSQRHRALREGMTDNSAAGVGQLGRFSN